jgi:hypothetical protein
VTRCTLRWSSVEGCSPTSRRNLRALGGQYIRKSRGKNLSAKGNYVFVAFPHRQFIFIKITCNAFYFVISNDGSRFLSLLTCTTIALAVRGTWQRACYSHILFLFPKSCKLSRCIGHVTSRPRTYTYSYAARSPAIPRASARAYIPNSLPSKRIVADLTAASFYHHVVRRHCTRVTTATSISALAQPACLSRRHRTQQHVITILYTCSWIVKSLTLTPLHAT